MTTANPGPVPTPGFPQAGIVGHRLVASLLLIDVGPLCRRDPRRRRSRSSPRCSCPRATGCPPRSRGSRRDSSRGVSANRLVASRRRRRSAARVTEPERPVALVTGGSSGIGLALAERLASRGMTVLLAARGRAPGCRPRPSACPDRCRCVADVVAGRRPRSARRGRTPARAARPAREQRRRERWRDGRRHRRRARLARARDQLPRPRRADPRAVGRASSRPRGAVVNVSSGARHLRASAARRPTRRRSTPSPAGRARCGSRDCARASSVLTLNPGPVSTAQFPHVEMARRRFARHLLIDAERCADDALRALDRGRGEIWSHPAYRLIASAQSIAPGFFARYLAPRSLSVYANSPLPTKSPGCVPGGTANRALVVCWMYSLSASVRPEPALQRRELPVRIALERDEEQARRRARSSPGRSRPRTSSRDAGGGARGSPTARRAGCARATSITGSPSARFAARFDDVVLLRAGQWCARVLEAADHAFLVGERVAVPRLDAHADAARHEVASRSRNQRCGSSSPDPHVAVHLRGVVRRAGCSSRP